MLARAFSKMLVPRISGLLVAILLVAGCAPLPELVGIENPDIPTNSVPNAKKQKIFLATTRQATEAVGAFYSHQRAPDLGLASVQVSIPPTHVVGKLERPKRLPPDPRTEFAIVEPTVYASDTAFIASINRELAALPREDRDILFFVHGYNNTTSDALLRLAQFAEDSDFRGVSVLFDWASAASVSRYVYDLNSALIARPRIPEISAILARTNAEQYDIFAHSMGAFLTMEAIKDARLAGQFDKTQRLKSIILASPDIDIDLFRAQLQQIGGETENIAVLLSKDDSALRISRRIAGGIPRLGAADVEELSDLGVLAIDLSEVDNSSSGSHSKFAGSPEIVQLLGKGLNQNARFDRYQRGTQLEKLIDGLPVQISFD